MWILGLLNELKLRLSSFPYRSWEKSIFPRAIFSAGDKVT